MPCRITLVHVHAHGSLASSVHRRPPSFPFQHSELPSAPVMEHQKPSLAVTRSISATFPLSQASTQREPSDISSPPDSDDRQISPRARRPAAPQPSDEGRRHKHSKSRDLRFSRPMSHLASASARGLLPTWSSKEKEPELLRPEGRWGSESTVSRKGSLVENEQLGPVRGIQSLEDLEKAKKRRKIGEEYGLSSD